MIIRHKNELLKFCLKLDKQSEKAEQKALAEQVRHSRQNAKTAEVLAAKGVL